jgi:CheY-like chemotaxis protein
MRPLATAARVNSPPRLLLVEDDALNREVALDQLKELGLSADVAINGAIAVAMAGDTAYDLILMDVQMPVLDGRQASRQILALPGRRQTPIIALTANVLPENRVACLAAGMVDYLEKPVATERLRSCLACWLPGVSLHDEQAASDGPGLQLIAALQATDGFAPALVLGTLGIKPEKYPMLLGKYLEVHGETVARAGAALQAGDRTQAQRLVHTLKGTAATLGLEATRDAAAQLDTLLEEAADAEAISHPFSKLAEVDRQQMATLRRLLASTAP